MTLILDPLLRVPGSLPSPVRNGTPRQTSTWPAGGSPANYPAAAERRRSHRLVCRPAFLEHLRLISEGQEQRTFHRHALAPEQATSNFCPMKAVIGGGHAGDANHVVILSDAECRGRGCIAYVAVVPRLITPCGRPPGGRPPSGARCNIQRDATLAARQ